MKYFCGYFKEVCHCLLGKTMTSSISRRHSTKSLCLSSTSQEIRAEGNADLKYFTAGITWTISPKGAQSNNQDVLWIMELVFHLIDTLKEFI